MSRPCLSVEHNFERIRVLIGMGYYARFFPILTPGFTLADLVPHLHDRISLHAFLAKHRSVFRPEAEDRKQCSRCGKVLHRSRFTKDLHRPDGLFHACKACTRDYRRQLRESGRKECSRCRRVLPGNAGHFHRNSAQRDGLGNECKACKRARQQAAAYRSGAGVSYPSSTA